MKLLQIKIPMAPAKTMIPYAEFSKVMRSAYDELCQLIPGLRDLRNSWPRLSILAIADQDYLVATLVSSAQLQLNLTPSDWRIGRVAELDASVIDQQSIKSSLELTEDLIATSGRSESQEIREGLEKIEALQDARHRNRLRKQLGNRYEISVFGDQLAFSLPSLQLTHLDADSRSFLCVVQQMTGARSFKASRVEISPATGLSSIAIDPRQVWTFLRLGKAQTLIAGRSLHESMALRQPITVRGRMVMHTPSQMPVAIEVTEVACSRP